MMHGLVEGARGRKRPKKNLAHRLQCVCVCVCVRSCTCACACVCVRD